VRCRRCNGKLWGREWYCLPCGLAHVDLLPERRGSIWQCELCDMAFDTVGRRNRHQSVHIDQPIALMPL
jgi:hypothetical protein